MGDALIAGWGIYPMLISTGCVTGRFGATVTSVLKLLYASRKALATRVKLAVGAWYWA